MKDRFASLVELVRSLGPAAVAFSGGVDSGLVALAAFHAHGKKAVAYTIASELSTKNEEKDARWLAKSIGIKHEVIRLKLLGVDDIARNCPDRCYHCKKLVFGTILEHAAKKGVHVLLDGTNADDLMSYRPGARAVAELGVRSPLAELGLGKDDIRSMAKHQDLPNHDKLSVPCLSTRFPYGERLTRERILRVHEAEEFIRSLGIEALRVRDHNGLARIEAGIKDIPMVASGRLAEKIVAKLTSLGYNYVTVDLEGFRSGSMDRVIGARDTN
ncbi:MAG TPA: ATP-dependent sacrificial sulfur transferase LarE [Nitrospirota bacterium]